MRYSGDQINLRDSVRFYQRFWSSGLGTLAMIGVTTAITIIVNDMQEPHNQSVRLDTKSPWGSRPEFFFATETLRP
jgi:hypothetical protein